MAKGIKRLLAEVRCKVAQDIGEHGANFGGALAGEGYSGGYRDALDDVFLALDGVAPKRRDWWPEPGELTP